MKKYVELDSLWKCETCFHHRNGKCAPNTWCEHGESYRPAYNKLKVVECGDVKHGHWYLLDECSNDGVYCSVCHKKVYRTNYANQKLKSPYCPNCGARMDGQFVKL
jgi:hypothetical protein